MASRIVAAVAVASVLSGCAHVHRIDPVASGSDLEDLNRAVQRRQVSVELVSSVPHRAGVTLRAEGVRVGADSTSLTLLLEPSEVSALWGEPSYGANRDSTLSTSAISRVTTRNRLRGAFDGVLVGLGVGVALGAVVGAVLATSDPWFGPVEEAIPASGLFFGIVGTGVGLVTGAIVGSREAYDFVDR
jgi:outer membrane murein-binding lipoprotein Lpp